MDGPRAPLTGIVTELLRKSLATSCAVELTLVITRLQNCSVLCTMDEGESPGLKIAINSTPTHYFGTRYHIECQKVSYTLYMVSKSVLYIQLVAIFDPDDSCLLYTSDAADE